MTGSTAALLRAPLRRPGRARDLAQKFDAGLSGCLTYRWELRRWFGLERIGTGPCLPWIMLNPSTADGRANDPTLWRIIAFSWAWGFDSLVVLNLYPYRSPDPRRLRDWCRWDERQDWAARDALHENWSRAARTLQGFDAAMVAWGSPAGSLAYETDLVAEAFFDTVNDPDGPRDALLDLFCLGESASGNPTHPMARGRHRVPDDALPRTYGRQPGTIVGLDRVSA